MCQKLSSLVNYHHNKLHVINAIIPLNERAENLRETLAYLSVKQLVSQADLSQHAVDCTNWQLSMLAEEFEKVDIENSDPYLLYVLLQLFDIAVGCEVAGSVAGNQLASPEKVCL